MTTGSYKFRISGDFSSEKIIGVEGTFIINALDSNNLAANISTEQISIKVQGPGRVRTSISIVKGTITVTYRPVYKPGVYEIHIFVFEKPILKKPFIVTFVEAEKKKKRSKSKERVPLNTDRLIAKPEVQRVRRGVQITTEVQKKPSTEVPPRAPVPEKVTPAKSPREISQPPPKQNPPPSVQKEVPKQEPNAPKASEPRPFLRKRSSSLPQLARSQGDRWMKQMQQKQEEKSDGFKSQSDSRTKNAVVWVTKEINKLIVEFRKLGKEGSDGYLHVTYGELFKATQNSMEALSGTLKAAKKQGIVNFSGEVLFQGTHDNVDIVLLKTNIRESQAVLSIHSVKATQIDRKKSERDTQFGKLSNCFKCTKVVYPGERLAANGKIFHKMCFQCFHCGMILKVSDYANYSEKFYCKAHYIQLFNSTAGYNALKKKS